MRWGRGTPDRPRPPYRRRAPAAHGLRLRRRRARQGGTATLYVDGDQVAAGQVERTHITMFTFDEPPTSVATLAPRSPTPTPDRQRLHRHRPLGPDRLGRRRPSPPHPTRAVASGGHDPPLARVQASSARATPQLRRDSARHAEQGRAACWVPLHGVRAGEVAWPHLIFDGSASVDPCHALELLRHLRLADRGLLAGGVPRSVTELSQGGPAGALRRACRAAGRWTGRPR